MWTGPAAVFYMSFDCLEGLNVMEGNGSVTTDVLTILGKVHLSEFNIFF